MILNLWILLLRMHTKYINVMHASEIMRAAHLVWWMYEVLPWTEDHLSADSAVVPLHQSLNTCMLK